MADTQDDSVDEGPGASAAAGPVEDELNSLLAMDAIAGLQDALAGRLLSPDDTEKLLRPNRRPPVDGGRNSARPQ